MRVEVKSAHALTEMGGRRGERRGRGDIWVVMSLAARVAWGSLTREPDQEQRTSSARVAAQSGERGDEGLTLEVAPHHHT